MSQSSATSHPGSTGNVIAAVCSFLLPGLGQLVQGRWLAAVVFFLLTAPFYYMGFLLLPLIPAVIFHILAIISAATWRGK